MNTRCTPVWIRTLGRSLLFVSVLALAGCDASDLICYFQQCNNASTDKPGSYSYYAIETFNGPIGEQEFCRPYGTLGEPTDDSSCFYKAKLNLFTPLHNNGWSALNAITDGNLNGTWTTPDVTAATIIVDAPNLMYISSHGRIINNAAMICLRRCDGQQYGNDYATGPPILPSSWDGPNWLAVDACDVVLPNVGWERLFGGNLHGILGFNTDGYGLNEAGLAQFAKDIEGYNKAETAWEDATGAAGVEGAISMLVPTANANDAIEASGGPHFGYNNDTQPQYIAMGPDGTVGPQTVSTLGSAPTSVYSLNAEQMDESYWYNYYGGGSVPSTTSHPSSNEDLYRNPYVSVDHYLASGGLSVVTAATGTAKGFSGAQAYQYALSWIQNNGGLPSDAVLTFAGDETMSPAPSQPTQDQPYPGVRAYSFMWRHANSAVLDNDFIQINVDDHGSLTQYQTKTWNVHCGCWVWYTYYAAPWIPKYHMRMYVRVWRTLAAALSTFKASFTAQAYGYCATDMTQPQSQATPCGVNFSSGRTTYTDLKYGGPVGAGENI